MTSPTDDRPDSLLRLIWRTERLESFPRTGWQVCGVSDPESVAAHSFGVAVIALWLADHIDRPVNTELVLRIALIHDLPEAMLTDLPRPVKERLGPQVCRDAEDQAAQDLFDPDLSHWRSHHRDYVAAQSLEAQLVKSADKIQMLAKALQYRVERRGRTERFFADRRRYDHYGIDLVAQIYDRLFERFHDDDWFHAGFA